MCDDLRSVCGKNRQPVRVERIFCLVSRQILSHFFFQMCAAKFLLFPARQPHNASIKLFYSKTAQYARRRVCRKNRDRFRVKKPFCLSMLQQLRRKCPVFRAQFQQRKRSGTVPCTTTNFVCLVSRKIPNLLRKTYAARAARIKQLREKSVVFPCVVSVAACFLQSEIFSAM